MAPRPSLVMLYLLWPAGHPSSDDEDVGFAERYLCAPNTTFTLPSRSDGSLPVSPSTPCR
jgi:hypothetical protein